MTYLRRRRVLLGLLPGIFAIGSVHAASITRTSAFEYDPATGLLTREIIEPDNIQLRLETAYTYDAYGNKTAATVSSPAIGAAAIVPRSSSTAYDARGQFPVSSTNALNQSETRVVDARFGAVSSLAGPNGLTTQWQYDNFGRKVLEIRADGLRTKWEYLYCSGVNGGAAVCPGGAKYLLQVTPLAADGVTQNGPWSKTYVDALEREIKSETQGFDGISVIAKNTEYDSLGRVSRVSNPYYNGQPMLWTVPTYDALGRIVASTLPDSTQTIIAYNGLTTGSTNALGQTQTKIKNSQGQLVQVIDAANNSIRYQYDPFGNLIKTTDPLGNITRLAYDQRGRKIQMIDPDMGTWDYAYNVLGELTRQTNAKGQVSTMAYDKLGRILSRAEPDLISAWTYDNCAKGIGKPCTATADNGYSRSHSYDSLGRAIATAATIDAGYTSALTFDANGRVATQTYPTGLTVKYVYTALGYLKEVRNNASDALYWRADTMDAQGHLLQQTYGNSVVTQQVYEASTGRLKNIYAGAGNGVQNLSYSYDSLGNLQSRNDANQNLNETFLYDSLNRLTSGTVNSLGAGLVTQSIAYNAIGNIVSRSDVGSYAYGPANSRPHALTEVQLAGGGKRQYTYDANGNLAQEVQLDALNNVIPSKGRIEIYTSFNMPQALGAPGISLAFAYSPEHQRIKQIAPGGTTIYLHPDNSGGLSYEKELKANGTTEHRHFITAGGQVVAVVKQTGAGTTVSYFHRDQLGSTTAMTNEAGTVIERLAYESFGKRRFAAGGTDPDNTIAGVNTDRGYTNHEHLDELGLIHMNGRIYDPVLGRFMSADPYIQSPGNLQSYNRYSYVMNNPLGFTDPSGYLSLFGHKILPGVFNNKNAKLFVTVAAAYVTQQWYLANIGGAVGAGAAGGFVGGMVGSGGNLKAGVIGAMTGAGFGWAGGVGGTGAIGANSFERYAAHALVGCASGELSGGGCGRGAASAVAGKWATNATDGLNDLAKGVAATVAGGTVSVIGGGSFANGATTAAFGYLFNYCTHNGCWTTPGERAYLDRGDFRGYYTEACRGGDLNACRFYGIGTGEEPGPSAVLSKALLANGYSFAETNRLVQSTIPLNLANDYANLLPQSEAQAAFPSAQAIAGYHWTEFGKYGLPASTFGGTPFGKTFDVVPRGLWCTLCVR
jgi:RHS repeat-associated protein